MHAPCAARLRSPYAPAPLSFTPRNAATYPTSMTIMSPGKLLDALQHAGTEEAQQQPTAAHTPSRAALHLPGAGPASKPVAALARSLGVDAVLVEVR
jgi:hypothetical protein